jgi:hypothetical protein
MRLSTKEKQSVERFSYYVQTTANEARNTGGAVVSHIENLSLFFSVDNGHVSNEFWSKSIQRFSH